MLLKEILDRMAQGGTWTIDSLARELDTTPLLVEMMVQDLERRGHLKRVTGNCGGACASCAAANGCLKESSQKMWALVKKKVRKKKRGPVLGGHWPSQRKEVEK